MITQTLLAQDKTLHQQLFKDYIQYKETGIAQRRFQQKDLLPIFKRLSQSEKFEVKTIGSSVEGRDLYQISMGTGPIQVLLWSQMHGDEPTATMALLDIFNFLNKDPLAKLLSQRLTMHFIPMLNPDGAEIFERRNALGIDLNRDALALQSPEAIALKLVRDKINADFGFNLHDQSIHYTVGHSGEPATISFLAPAYNYAKDLNPVRQSAMQVISQLNEILQSYIPGKVAKYNDDFEPRAYGDNMQLWGTSTILIESGGYPDDPEKQQIRKLNYLAILMGLFIIADQSYKQVEVNAYQQIPENERFLLDLLIRNLGVEKNGHIYGLDVGIIHQEIERQEGFYYKSSIEELGDLSIFSGYKELDATGLRYQVGKVYPQIFTKVDELKSLNQLELLKQGFTMLKVDPAIRTAIGGSLPFNLIDPGEEVSYALKVDHNPTFTLQKAGVSHYAVINGFIFDLIKNENNIKNSWVH